MAIAVVFPGQGSQFAGMADAWMRHPSGEAVLEEASAAIGRDIVAGCHDEEALATTEFVQPALLTCGVAAFRVLETEGIDDTVGVAGHSLGEFAALVASEAMSLPDALELVIVRGGAMQRASEARPGAMVALLGVDADQAAELCERVRGDDVLVVANENSPAQVVISGSVDAIERAEAAAKQEKIRAVRLNVAGAFHSALMEPARTPVLDVLDRVEVRDPVIPVAENVTGSLVTDAAELRTLLGRQVVSPVRWERSVRSLAAAGATTFLEAGPGDVLTKLAKRIVPEVVAVPVGDPEAAHRISSAP
jgi:[acyl-carrier-protein] S-malonyltransferase